MPDAATPLTNLSHDIVEQAARLADAILPDASASEAAELVELAVTIDIELRFGAALLAAPVFLERLIELASDLCQRIPFCHPAAPRALTLVASAEILGQALRRRDAAPSASAGPFRRMRREDCSVLTG